MAIPVKWAFYQDVNGNWRWRHFGSDNSVINESDEGFSSRHSCEDHAKRYGYKNIFGGLDLENGNFD